MSQFPVSTALPVLLIFGAIALASVYVQARLFGRIVGRVLAILDDAPPHGADPISDRDERSTDARL